MAPLVVYVLLAVINGGGHSAVFQTEEKCQEVVAQAKGNAQVQMLSPCVKVTLKSTGVPG